MSKTVIVGSGRSGTRYCSALLRASGVRCGHEEVYNFSVAMGGKRIPDWKDFDADASWMAVPFLQRHGLRSIHVVREPLIVVRSMLQLGWFYPGERQIIRRIVQRHSSSIFSHKSREDKILALWLEWNRNAHSRSVATFRIEDLGHKGPRRSEFVSLAGGEDPTEYAVDEIIADDVLSNRKTPNKIHPQSELEWTSFSNQLAEAARCEAERYGYRYE